MTPAIATGTRERAEKSFFRPELERGALEGAVEGRGWRWRRHRFCFFLCRSGGRFSKLSFTWSAKSPAPRGSSRGGEALERQLALSGSLLPGPDWFGLD